MEWDQNGVEAEGRPLVNEEIGYELVREKMNNFRECEGLTSP